MTGNARGRPDGSRHPRKTLVPIRVSQTIALRVAAGEGAGPERVHDLSDCFIDLRIGHKHNVQSFAMVTLQSANLTHRAWPNC